MGFDGDVGVDRLELSCSCLGFGVPDVRRGIENLALQVASVYHVKINNANPPHACAREVEAQRRPEAAGTNEENGCLFEFFLTFKADLRQGKVPGILFQFLW